MFTSQKGIDLIKKYEGCKLEAYKCPAGIWTIGYGTTKGVKQGMKITQAQAEEYLRRDIIPLESTLNSLGINFTQNQFDALISWLYNLGTGNFNSSTLKKKIVARAKDLDITDQIIKWINSNGKPLLGLKKRRVEEANMFLNGNIYHIDMAGTIKR
jgi:lysozyme